MIRHIVAWNFKEEFGQAENLKHAEEAKKQLEELINTVPHVSSIKVRIDLKDTSTRKVVLDSLFENMEELEKYQQHPKHKEAAVLIRFAFTDRICLDFEE